MTCCCAVILRFGRVFIWPLLMLLPLLLLFDGGEIGSRGTDIELSIRQYANMYSVISFLIAFFAKKYH